MPRTAVDAATLERRAAAFATRSFKRDAKVAALDLAISCIDLTTLEGRDTPGKVRALCGRARLPGAGAPPVAAVCVYPELVATAAGALRGSSVLVASVATAFPSGLSAREIKLRDVELALRDGADEIDMVIDRGAFLAGAVERVSDEIAAVKRLCGERHLKVILEVGELVTYAAVREASECALEAGADTIKTSTGKAGISATLPYALVMAETLRDFYHRRGDRRGLKIAGGVRTAKAALAYLALIDETLGGDWLTPHLFRIGASSLLDDLVLQRERERTGHYGSASYLPKE